MKLSQEQINSLALRFKEAEWAWLTQLSKEERYLLEEGHPEEYDPTAYTHYGEFFLTICGIKPCFLISNPNYPAFGEALYHRVLKYLLPELPGFEFFRVEHPVPSPKKHYKSPSSPQVSNSPITVAAGSSSTVSQQQQNSEVPHCLRSPNDRINHYGNNQVIFIFTSRYHPKFPLIEELLMKPKSSPVPAELLGKALGYPVPCGQSTFSYIDQTTTQELGGNCGVVVFEFTARAGFEHSIKMHFERCAEEFRKLGKVLTITCQ